MNQLVVTGKEGLKDCFLRLEVMVLVRENEFGVGWSEGSKWVFAKEGFGLKRGEKG